MAGHILSEKGLQHLWRWARHDLPETHESTLAAVFVVCELRERGIVLTDDQRRLVEVFEKVMTEEARDA